MEELLILHPVHNRATPAAVQDVAVPDRRDSSLPASHQQVVSRRTSVNEIATPLTAKAFSTNLSSTKAGAAALKYVSSIFGTSSSNNNNPIAKTRNGT